MARINQLLIRHSDVFFGYEKPTDFRLEERHPELFPTNVRPETLAKDAEIKHLAAEGKTQKAQFLRFTSPERTPVSRKRSGECALVSRARAQGSDAAQTGDCGDAAMERRCIQP